MRRVLPLIAFILVGCTESRAYHVTVRNLTSGPITVGFVKDGPPLEQRWMSPEELTDTPPSRRPTHWGLVIAQGNKASTVMKGDFASNTHALLRVYLGDHPVEYLLAMSRGFGDRTEVRLEPEASNDYTITAPDGRIFAHVTTGR